MDNTEFQKLLNAELPLIVEETGLKLVLSYDGFEAKRNYSSWRYQWKNTSDFITLERPSFEYYRLLFFPRETPVYFNNKTSRMWGAIKRFFNRGYTDSLPFVYGLSSLTSPQLAQLLNHWRERALQQNG